MSDDEEFEARLIRWLEMPGEGELYPHDANPHPYRSPRCQLRSFDCLCALYPEADEAQRAQICATFAR